MLNAENMLLISDWQQTERGVTILQADIQKFIEYCNRILDFSNIDSQYSYKSLPVCVIDCVYSLRAQYFSTTVPVVDRYAEMYLQGDKFTSVDTLKDFMDRVDQSGGCEKFADAVLQNKQSLSGRRKTEICYELAKKMLDLLSINTLEEFQSYEKPELLDIVLRSVKGFGDAGINYLYMMAGDSSKCKPDVHIHHCIRDAIGKDVSNEQCQYILTKAVESLVAEHPHLTVRCLDGLIWNKYQIGNR